jgi:drug/metabolite transporter (DMT)-like permease
MKPVPWAAFACLAASMALVGSYVGLSRLLVAALPVFLLAWLRFGIAAVAMVTWLRRQPGEAPLSARDRRLLFWESFLGNFGFSICMLFGVAATSAVAAGVVMAAIPAAVALMSRMFLGERITRRVQVAIGLAVAGIGLLALARVPDGAGQAPAAPWCARPATS